mgnify:FL=1
MKIGRWTVAGSFILLGLVLLLNHWTETNLFLKLLPWWPVLIVALGLEMLFYNRKKERAAKFDVIGIVLLALVVIGASVFAGVQGLAFALTDDISLLDFLNGDWTEHPLDEITIPIQDEDTLAIKNNNGSINITAHDGEDIVIEPTVYTVKGKGPRTLKDFRYTMHQNGPTISLDVHEAGNVGFGFSFGDRHWRPVKLEVKVPASFSVDLESDNGEINVRDLDGDVNVLTDNGKMHVLDIGGNVILQSDNGLIRATNIDGAVDVQTDNGMIYIDNIGSELLAQTETGKIEVESPRMSGNWEVVTDVGMIDVTIPDTVSTTIRAETELGNTFSDFPLRDDRNDVVGVVGDGNYNMLLKTSAGRIGIKQMSQ